MNTRVLVSIVTYNSDAVIIDCIEHLIWLADAEGIEAQIVVADNASTDSTAEFVQRISKSGGRDLVTLVRSEANLGWGAGNNLAISARRWDPDYVLLCNPDAYIDERNFRGLLHALRGAEPQAAIAVPFLQGPDGTVLGANPEWGLRNYFLSGYTSGKRPYRRFQARFSGRRGSFRVPNAYASGALALISFSVLRDAGFFDERIFMYNDDIDVTRRILAEGHTLLGTAAATAHHLGGEGSRLGEEAAADTSLARLHYESELVFVEKWYGHRWALLVARYRWYVFFPLSQVLRRMARRAPIPLEALRTPAAAYLKSQANRK